MTAAAFLFESLSHAGFPSLYCALFAGYAVLGLDGRVYLTEAGGAYLASRAHG